jgi:hypothetical protein
LTPSDTEPYPWLHRLNIAEIQPSRKVEQQMAGITVQIVAGTTTSSSSVSASGSVQHIITDKEVQSFGIQDNALKAAIAKYFGKSPNDAYLHSDTPWGDLYKTYGWPQVQTVLSVANATVTGITSQPVIVAQQVFKNNSNKRGTFNVGISDSVSNTTESNWSTSNTIDVTQTVKYGISFLGMGGGGSTSMSYSRTWGQGGSESENVTVGSSQGVTVELDPGESVQALLTASRGVMKVRIVYNASLIGASAINYNPRFKDHHFWAVDLPSVMAAGGIKNSLQFTEDIEIGFFANAEVELKNAAGKAVSTLKAVAAISDSEVLLPA